MLRTTVASGLKRTILVLDDESGIALTERMIGRGRTRAWPPSDIGNCSIEGAAVQMKGAAEKELVLEAGATRLRLGKGLSERELRAVAEMIDHWRSSRRRTS